MGPLSWQPITIPVPFLPENRATPVSVGVQCPKIKNQKDDSLYLKHEEPIVVLNVFNT